MESVKVRSMMTTRVSTVGANQTIMEASQMMGREKVNCLVVMAGRSPAGMITDSDITRYVVSKGLDPKETKVSEVMSSPLVFVSPEDSIEKARKTLSGHKVNRLAVIENGNLAGIITDADISRVRTADKIDQPQSPFDNNFSEGMTKKPDWDRGSGFCDFCGNHEDDLVTSGDERLCRTCMERKRQAGPYWVSRKKSGESFTG
ncbi:MAG: CBS domain-containing protein [Candidatus Aenigmarchaeota archaeon]|nr:CBS domain-containing protein [Candidatus Aenigmarchaeota archaeon]